MMDRKAARLDYLEAMAHCGAKDRGARGGSEYRGPVPGIDPEVGANQNSLPLRLDTLRL